MHRTRALLLVIAVAVQARTVAAQPAEQPPPEPAPADAPPPPEPPPPPPDQASGIAEREPTPFAHHLLWIPRGLLFLPRWGVWLVGQPFRLGAWAYEKYQLPERFRRSLFNVDQTFGIYPIATIDSTFGVNGGLRVIHKDLFGARERLKLSANFGGRFRQAYGGTLRSGDRFGKRFAAELDVRYERRPFERFYGIGNEDELEDDDPPAMRIDPSVEDTAIATRFRESLTRAVLTADTKIAGPLSLFVSGAYTRREFAGADGDEINITEAYDTARLLGFDRGVDDIYVEGELVYDSRRPVSSWQSRAIDATGWYLAAHFGRAAGIAGDPTDYYRYGGEIQRYLDLYHGSRVLALRVLVDAVGGTNGRTDDKISFAELPRLGGSEFLRGYTIGRFRDRSLALATAEYTWDLGNYLAAYGFVDVGRVLPSLRDIELDDDDVRVGFGGGVQIHTNSSFLMRGQLAASREGNILLELVISPVFGRRERAGKF